MEDTWWGSQMILGNNTKGGRGVFLVSNAIHDFLVNSLRLCAIKCRNYLLYNSSHRPIIYLLYNATCILLKTTRIFCLMRHLHSVMKK
jgi:hypothetical protein